MDTTNLPTKLVLVLMCVLSLAGCSALRHRHRETTVLDATQLERKSLEAVSLSDSLAKRLLLSADNLELRLYDSVVTLRAINLRLGQQTQAGRHYGKTTQQSDTLTHVQCQWQSKASQTETGVIATTPNHKGNPLPWILAAVLIVVDGCLLFRRKRWK